jgi:hypothetical protein
LGHIYRILSCTYAYCIAHIAYHSKIIYYFEYDPITTYAYTTAYYRASNLPSLSWISQKQVGSILGTRSAAARHRAAQHVVRSITLRFVLTRTQNSNSNLEVIEQITCCSARCRATADPGPVYWATLLIKLKEGMIIYFSSPVSAQIQNFRHRTVAQHPTKEAFVSCICIRYIVSVNMEANDIFITLSCRRRTYLIIKQLNIFEIKKWQIKLSISRSKECGRFGLLAFFS